MTVETQQVRDWLRQRRDKNELHLHLMALQYDLDGALAARQFGLAWWARRRVLLCAARLFLSDVGVAIRSGTDRTEVDLDVLDAIARMNPALGETLWQIARDRLGPGASAGAVAREMARIWELNAKAIASGDPDLIRPGERLILE